MWLAGAICERLFVCHEPQQVLRQQYRRLLFTSLVFNFLQKLLTHQVGELCTCYMQKLDSNITQFCYATFCKFRTILFIRLVLGFVGRIISGNTVGVPQTFHGQHLLLTCSFYNFWLFLPSFCVIFKIQVHGYVYFKCRLGI